MAHTARFAATRLAAKSAGLTTEHNLQSTINSIGSNLMSLLVPNSANLTNLLAASSTTANTGIDSAPSSSIPAGSAFPSVHLATQSQVTAALLMQLSALQPVNQSGHLHPPQPFDIKKWPYSWPATHLVRDSNLLPSVVLNYLSLCLLAVSFVLNLYMWLVILFGRAHCNKTHSLMKHIFVSNLLLVCLSLPFEVHQHLSTSSTSSLITYLLCKVVPSVQIITEFVTAVSITILAVDKWQSISHSPRITNASSMKVFSFGIWTVGIILWLSILLFSSSFAVPIDSPVANFSSITVCRLDLFSFYADPNAWFASTFNFIFLVAYICVFFMVPLIIAALSHSKTHLHLLEHGHQYSHVHDLQKRIRTSDKETVCMLTFVLGIFATAWLPWHVLQFGWYSLGLMISSGMQSPIGAHAAQLWSAAFFGSRQVILLATILIPLAYLFFSRSIRKQFLEHSCTALCLVCPFFKKYHHFHPFIANHSTSSNSSTSSTSSSATTEGGNCKNSLQKLLPETNQVPIGSQA